MATAEELMKNLDAVARTAMEVQEMLKKSMPVPPPMNKNDDEEQNGAPPSDMPPPAPEGGEAPPSDMPPPAPEGGEAPPAEGEEGSPVDEFAQEISAMSDDELGQMLQALAAEMDKRKQAQAAPAGDQPPAPAAAPSPEMDAMKSENAMLKKSMKELAAKVDSLQKSMSRPAATARPVASNRPAAVQQKTHAEPELMNKSDVMTHLESLKKSGNRKVTTDLVWLANRANSAEDLRKVYHEAKVAGIDIPTK